MKTKPYFYFATHNGNHITSGVQLFKSKKDGEKTIKRTLVHRNISGEFNVWVFRKRKNSPLKFTVEPNLGKMPTP